MISSLQPQRPRPPQQHAHPPHIPYQQTRASTTSTSPSPSTAPPSSPSPYTYQPPTQTQPPRNQLEAMPPSSTPSQPRFTTPSSPLYNAATRHPVFFTSSLFKPPFPLPRVASQAGWSPVASGYVFEQGSARRREGERTKL